MKESAPGTKHLHISLYNVHSTSTLSVLAPKRNVVVLTQNLDRSRLNGIRRKDQNRRGSDNGELSRTLNLAARGPHLGSCPFRILPGQKERFESGQGARDAGGGGSGAKEAVNETGAQKGAGKGGKGQRAAEESEKGKKLRESGRGRRSRTARGPRKDRKAGRGEREVPRQGQAAAAEGARRGPGPAQAVSARARRNQRRAGPEEATRGPVGPGGRNAVSRPLPVPSGLSPPRSWGAPAIHSPVLIDSPRTQRLTDPDPNPRRGGEPAPPRSRIAPASLGQAPRPLSMLLPPE